jgi:uncharacterized protein YigE (DUF2233 family)
MATARLFSIGLIGLCLLLPASSTRSQAPARAKLNSGLAVADGGAWRAILKGVEFRRIALERAEPNYLMELKLVRFDSHLIVPKILAAEQFQLKTANAKTFGEKSRALATINASYFDEKGRPLAYLKTAEKEINRTVSRHALYTGVFGRRESIPFVTHRDSFLPGDATEALQSGPLLLYKSAPAEISGGLGRYARRSVVGIDKEGRVIIGVTDTVVGGLSFAEMQELFAAAKWEIETPDLLNLDGGGSAQLYVKTGKFEEWLSGTTEVPVAIGFFSKAN